jgi:hypothetical protein
MNSPRSINRSLDYIVISNWPSTVAQNHSFSPTSAKRLLFGTPLLKSTRRSSSKRSTRVIRIYHPDITVPVVLIVMIIFFDHAAHQPMFPQLLDPIRVRGKRAENRAHDYVIRPPRFHEDHHVPPARRLGYCTWEWIPAEPSADDPRFQCAWYVLWQQNIQNIQSLLLSNWPCLRQNGRIGRRCLLHVFF